MSKTPRDYQEAAIGATFQYFEEKTGNPLIALPTGAGKALVIAEICKRALQAYPGTRIEMATHTKELVQQNTDELLGQWRNAPVGVFCVGLDRAEHMNPLTFGSIQSMVGKEELFGHRDLMLIDEAHLVSPAEETSYQLHIAGLRRRNPLLKIIGLSATIYRLKLGLLTNGNIFTDVAFDMTNMEGINKLIAEGYLSPVIPKRMQTQIDLNGVVLNAEGEFQAKGMQAAADKAEVTYGACAEIVEHGRDRKAWLVFASGIDHAKHIAQHMTSHHGIRTGVVHSKQNDNERDDTIAAFKAGKLRCLVNNGVLTTGFNHPPTDLIALVRATMSPGLYVQMVGRGMRPADGKENCLVLDFAGNTARLGPVNDPIIPRPKGQGTGGEPPVRICDACGTYNHASARVCIGCGLEFPITLKFKSTSGTDELLRTETPQIEIMPVQRVVYLAHTSKAGNGSMKVAYYSGFNTLYEYISVEAEGFRGKMGRDWFRARRMDKTAPPETNAALVQLAPSLRVPTHIKVNVAKKPVEVVGYVF